MHPAKVNRDRLKSLTDLPNVGPRIAGLLVAAGVDQPDALRAWDPYALYQAMCASRNARLDPCVLDVCLSIVHFVQGESPRSWWVFTAKRKRLYPNL